MTYFITEPCIGEKDASCIDVCPVDCIHPRTDEAEWEKEEMIYIDPEECIDCGACEPACPVEAILSRLRPSRKHGKIPRHQHRLLQIAPCPTN